MAMKIQSLSSQQRSRTMTTRERALAGRVGGIDTSFSTELNDQESSLTREELEHLLKKIDEQGARLTNTPTYDELKAYRDLVKDFVDEAVGRMYQLHVQAGWDRMGRQKVYTTVRKIDRKLEELAEKIRMGHTEALDIVASHDAIRGMLVDLYM